MNKINQGKLKLSQFFLKRFVPLIIVATILFAMGVFVTEIFLQDMMSTRVGYEFLLTCRNIEDSEIKGSPENIIRYFSGIYGDIGTTNPIGMTVAMVVTDAETGDIAATSEFAVYAIYRPDKDTPATIYMCNDKEVVDFYLSYINEDVFFNIGDIYVKDNKFIPEKVIVQKLDMDGDEILGTATGDAVEKTFTPPDGYEYLGEANLSVAIGTHPESPVLRDIVDRVSGKPGEYAYDAITESYVIDYENAIRYNSSEIELNGRKYNAYSIASMDFWSVFLVPAVLFFIGVFGFVVVISFIWAKISYIKYSAKYDTDEARRNMVNSLAHDLKSPLMAISGYAENLAADSHPEKKDYYANAIMENTAYMNTIITSTLELSKTENVAAVKKEQIDIPELVISLYEKYRPEAESKGISFRSEGICNACADKVLISAAIENLLTNAVKFTPDGGAVSVKSDSESITFSNTCKSTAELEKLDLTAPFVKGNESRSNRTGTGIGLSIAKAACERQNFDLQLKLEESNFTAIIKLK